MTKENSNKQAKRKDTGVIEGYLLQAGFPSEALLEKFSLEYHKGTPPSRLRNKFKDIRRKAYTRLFPHFSVRVLNGVYFVPSEKLLEFQEAKSTLIQEYKELESSLRKYIKEARGKPRDLRLLERVDIRLIPFRLSPTLFKNYVEKKWKPILRERSMQNQGLLRQAKAEIEQTYKEMMENAASDLNERLEKIIHKLTEISKQKIHKRALRSLNKAIERISELAQATNTTHAIHERLEIAQKLVRIQR